MKHAAAWTWMVAVLLVAMAAVGCQTDVDEADAIDAASDIGEENFDEGIVGWEGHLEDDWLEKPPPDCKSPEECDDDDPWTADECIDGKCEHPLCHTDCFGDATCSNGIVTIDVNMPVPCSEPWPPCPTASAITCVDGCWKVAEPMGPFPGEKWDPQFLCQEYAYPCIDVTTCTGWDFPGPADLCQIVACQGRPGFDHGFCDYRPVICDDQDSCTEDFCDPTTGCVHIDMGQVGGDGCCHLEDTQVEDPDCPCSKNAEFCDGLDNDCDDLTDETPGAAIFSDPFLYVDGDGWVVETGDMNGDEWLDVVVLDRINDSDVIRIFLGDEKGGLAESGSDWGDTDGLHGVSFRIVDMDGDGLADVVTAPCQNNSLFFSVGVGMWHGEAGGHIDFKWCYLAPSGYGVHDLEGIDSSDLNQDGKPDLLAYSENDGLFVFINPGAGFQTGKPDHYESDFTGKGLKRVTLTDLNGDGAPDAVALSGLGQVQILWNDGTGGFADKTTQALGSGTPMEMVVADFDQDGDPDPLVHMAIPDGSFGLWIRTFKAIYDRRWGYP